LIRTRDPGSEVDRNMPDAGLDGERLVVFVSMFTVVLRS
jgi:hypothetical protein